MGWIQDRLGAVSNAIGTIINVAILFSSIGATQINFLEQTTKQSAVYFNIGATGLLRL